MASNPYHYLDTIGLHLLLSFACEWRAKDLCRLLLIGQLARIGKHWTWMPVLLFRFQDTAAQAEAPRCQVTGLGDRALSCRRPVAVTHHNDKASGCHLSTLPMKNPLPGLPVIGFCRRYRRHGCGMYPLIGGLRKKKVLIHHQPSICGYRCLSRLLPSFEHKLRQCRMRPCLCSYHI